MYVCICTSFCRQATHGSLQSDARLAVPSIYLSIYLSVYLSIYICVCAYLCVCMRVHILISEYVHTHEFT